MTQNRIRNWASFKQWFTKTKGVANILVDREQTARKISAVKIANRTLTHALGHSQDGAQVEAC